MGPDPVTSDDLLVSLRDAELRRPARKAGDESFELAAPEFDIRSGQRIALCGPSGSGKTTLLEILALAVPPSRAGRHVACPPGGPVDVVAERSRGGEQALNRLRSRLIGYARHSGESVAFLTAREAVDVRVRLAGKRIAPRERDELLASFGLAEVGARHPAQLSQGQRQRLGVACALAHRPGLVIADEPTASLDGENARRMMQRLAGCAGEGRAVLIATHDPDLAARNGFTILEASTTQSGEASGPVKRTVFTTLASAGAAG